MVSASAILPALPCMTSDLGAGTGDNSTVL
jgi:hypothetical protein